MKMIFIVLALAFAAVTVAAGVTIYSADLAIACESGCYQR